MSTPDSAVPDAGSDEAQHGSAVSTWLGRVCRLLLAAAILAAGFGVSLHWLMNRPAAQRRSREREAALVEVRALRPGVETVTLRAMGTVVPARSIQLAARVSGQTVQVSPKFVPGGRFNAGERILQIEQKDYELVVEQRKSDLTRVESELKLELGRQSVAQREYELLGQEVQKEDEELLLREPQLAMAEAAVSAARALLDQARLDLQRTAVTAPFNCTVLSRSVELGSQVSVGMGLASLVGTDECWIQALVPTDELRWIRIPGFKDTTGSAARVYYEPAWGPDVARGGAVVGLMTELEPEGRMAMLLISVKDPLQLSSPAERPRALILGSYVRVEIDGRELRDVVRVPRTALRDGDRVWLMSTDGTLDIRDVTVAWSGNDYVYVSEGLSDGDLLVTSDLAAPVAGTALRTTDSSPPPHPGGGPGRSSRNVKDGAHGQ